MINIAKYVIRDFVGFKTNFKLWTFKIYIRTTEDRDLIQCYLMNFLNDDISKHKLSKFTYQHTPYSEFINKKYAILKKNTWDDLHLYLNLFYKHLSHQSILQIIRLASMNWDFDTLMILMKKREIKFRFRHISYMDLSKDYILNFLNMKKVEDDRFIIFRDSSPQYLFKIFNLVGREIQLKIVRNFAIQFKNKFCYVSQFEIKKFSRFLNANPEFLREFCRAHFDEK